MADTRHERASAARSVVDVAQSVLAELDLETVLDRVVQAARELTGARYAALGVLDSSRHELERFVTSGVDEATRRRIGALPRGRGILGELIAEPVCLRLQDLGSHPHSYGFPAGHPPMRTFLGVPVLVEGRPFGNLYLAEKSSGAQFDEEDERSVGVLAQLAAMAIDHARRYGEVAARRAELERTVRALDATVQIARAVGGETNLEVILTLVAKRARALVSARGLAVVSERGGDMVLAAAAGELPGTLVGQILDPSSGLAAAGRLTTPATFDLASTACGRHDPAGLGSLGVGARAGLVVPMMFRGRPQGAIVAIDRIEDGPGFDAEDQRLLESFAASAATAVATARSVEIEGRRQRLAAAERERSHWARELHDETLQNLAALRLAVGAHLRAGDPRATTAVLRDVVEELDHEITGLRGMISELRPSALDDLGVEAALEELADRIRRRGLAVDLDVVLPGERAHQHSVRMRDAQTAIYRITQEALTNAVKHARAARAQVEICESDGAVRITVRDDGDGYDPGTAGSGFGLLGMRERAELSEGTFGIESAPGVGTAVTALIPLGAGSPPRGDDAAAAPGAGDR